MLSVAYSEVKPQHSADNSQGGCWSAPVLPNVSFFGNYYLVYDVCSSNDFLFIYLDEELVWTESCGALQLVQRGSSMSGIFCTFSFKSSVISSQENLIGITLSKYDWLISVGRICVCQLLFSLVLLVITKRMQPAWTSKDYQPF